MMPFLPLRRFVASSLGCFLLLLAPLLLVAAASAGAGAQAEGAGAEWRLVDEHWYTIELGGAKAGWLVETVRTDGDHYRSETEARLTIGRGLVATSVEIRSSFVETLAGRPVALESTQDMASQPLTLKWRFEDDRVVQITRQGEREKVRALSLPAEPWLTPMAAHRYWLERRQAEAKEITYRTIDPQAGLNPVSVRHVYVGADQFEIGDRTIPVTRWKTTTSILPIETLEAYSLEGYLVYQEVNAGIGKMVTRIATKAEARADGGQPELLIKTFVTPSRPIDNAVGSTTATLRLQVKGGSMPALPTAGAQRASVSDDGTTATVTIDIHGNQPAPAEAAEGPYLRSSGVVDAEDPLIRKLAAGAVRGAGEEPMAKAEAMRASVHRLVSEKGLDTAFATASETARMKSGDCSEHAVLLCAMLRAEGIPARVAIGLIYAERFLGQRSIFGWHMWTQALVDGAWVDFDATLPRRYHAAHVLVNTSSLDDGTLNTELASTLVLMGNLEIEVVEVGYGGEGTEGLRD
ncbi:MAG: transglutaminase domain-containing protein [Planctomycetota bacterium]|jgi:transglutaminase-like putative cysteine protease